MQGLALCVFGVAVLAASLALGDQRGSTRLERLSFTLAALAGTLFAVGFVEIVLAT
jgi:hypothetical protein